MDGSPRGISRTSHLASVVALAVLVALSMVAALSISALGKNMSVVLVETLGSLSIALIPDVAFPIGARADGSGHRLQRPARVFAWGVLLAMAGLMQWATGYVLTNWPIKMIGVGVVTLGCFVATGALIFAEEKLRNG